REKIWEDESRGPQSESGSPETAAPHTAAPRHARVIRDNSPYASQFPRRRLGAHRTNAAQTHGKPSSYTRSRPNTPSKAIVPPPPDTAKACADAKVVLEEILPLLQVTPSKITTGWDADQVRVRAELETPDAEFLLGQEGKTLESLQFIVTLTLSRRLQTPVAVQVEVGTYWHDKEEEIILQVHQAMEEVKRTKQSVRLKPMDAVMRRLVHRTLANHPEIETISEGEGQWRKVVLKPRRK